MIALLSIYTSASFFNLRQGRFDRGFRYKGRKSVQNDVIVILSKRKRSGMVVNPTKNLLENVFLSCLGVNSIIL